MKKKIIVGIVLLILILPWFLKERAFYTVERDHRMTSMKLDVRFRWSVVGGDGILFKHPFGEISEAEKNEQHNDHLRTNFNAIVVETEEEAEAIRADRQAAPDQSDQSDQGVNADANRRASAILRRDVELPDVVQRKEAVDLMNEMEGIDETPVMVGRPTTVTREVENGIVIVATSTGATSTKEVKLRNRTATLQVSWVGSRVSGVSLDGKRLGEAGMGVFMGIPVMGTIKRK